MSAQPFPPHLTLDSLDNRNLPSEETALPSSLASVSRWMASAMACAETGRGGEGRQGVMRRTVRMDGWGESLPGLKTVFKTVSAQPQERGQRHHVPTPTS